MSIIEKIKDLSRQIKLLSYEYHIMLREIDQELYDKLRIKLEQLEEQYPKYLFADSPSLSLIAHSTLNIPPLIQRKIPMLSLKNLYNDKDLINFLKKYQEQLIYIEPKIDGVGLSIIYINNYLDSISLRGDGFQGENITTMLGLLNNIPSYIPNIKYMEIRGECHLSNNIIVNTNRRNIAAGILRKKTLSKKYKLNFIAYKSMQQTTHQEDLEFLSKYFTIPYAQKLIYKDIESLNNTIQEVYNKKYPFDIDGVVLKLNQYNQENYNARYPADAAAFKFGSSTKITDIISIKWSIGRQNQLIPTCIIKPVMLHGTIINKIYAYNSQFLQDNAINIDSRINITKSGSIVPKIIDVIVTKPFRRLLTCPLCHASIINKKIFDYCTNVNCARKIKIEFFFRNLNLKGLGTQTIKAITNTNIVNSLQEFLKQKWIINENDQKIWKQFINKEYSINDLLIAMGINNISKHHLSKHLNILQDYKNLPDGKKNTILKEFIDKNYHDIKLIYYMLKEKKLK